MDVAEPQFDSSTIPRSIEVRRPGSWLATRPESHAVTNSMLRGEHTVAVSQHVVAHVRASRHSPSHMAMRIVGIVWCLPVFLFSLNALAEEQVQAAPHDLLETYRAHELHIELNAWRSPRVVQGDVPMHVGYFGTRAEEVFGGSRAALESMSRFTTLRVSGFTLYMVGLLGLVAELVALPIEPNLFLGEDPAITSTFWVWTLSSAVIGLVGAMLVNMASNHLSRAVRQHNDDIYRRLRGRARTEAGSR